MIPIGRIFCPLLVCLLLSVFSEPPRAQAPPLINGEEDAIPGPVPAIAALSVQIPEEEYCGIFLDIRVSKEVFYAGEPVTLEITANFPGNTEDVRLDLPVFENSAFEFEDPEGEGECTGEYLKIPLERGEAWADRTCVITNGKPCTTLSFRKTLIACTPGTIAIPESTLTVLAPEEITETVGTPYDNLPDESLHVRTTVTDRIPMVRSGTFMLEVLPVPVDATSDGDMGMATSEKYDEEMQQYPLQTSEWKDESSGHGERDIPVIMKADQLSPTGSAYFPADLLLLLVLFLNVCLIRRNRPERVIHSEESRSDKAFSVFKRRIGLIRSSRFSDSRCYSHLLDALTGYACDKLDLEREPPDFFELERLLKDHGGTPRLLARLSEIFSHCEQIKLGGDFQPERTLDSLARDAYLLVQELDIAISLETKPPGPAV